MAILVRNLGGTVNEKPAMMISVDDHEKLGPELEAYFPEKMFFTLEELKSLIFMLLTDLNGVWMVKKRMNTQR